MMEICYPRFAWIGPESSTMDIIIVGPHQVTCFVLGTRREHSEHVIIRARKQKITKKWFFYADKLFILFDLLFSVMHKIFVCCQALRSTSKRRPQLNLLLQRILDSLHCLQPASSVLQTVERIINLSASYRDQICVKILSVFNFSRGKIFFFEYA